MKDPKIVSKEAVENRTYRHIDLIRSHERLRGRAERWKARALRGEAESARLEKLVSDIRVIVEKRSGGDIANWAILEGIDELLSSAPKPGTEGM